MLITKKIEENDIVAVKLISGEELVGKLIKHNPLELAKPIVLGMQQQPNPTTGQVEVGLGFAPFMLGMEDGGNITLEPGAYIVILKARDEIKQAYIKSTTGLDVPPSNLVV